VRDVPFFLYLICGLFPWQFFQNSIVQGATSLIDNKNLIKESRFPHYVIPFSILLSNGAVFLPSLILIVVVSLFVQGGLSVSILLLPAVLLIHFCLTFGVAVLVSILCLKWRNLPHFLEIGLTFLFYWAPIVYPLYLVKESLSGSLLNFYLMNPFTGLILLYRMTLLRGFSVPLEGFSFHLLVWGLPALFSVGVLFFALTYYRQNRGWINDYLAY